ncbi:hypothetical protein ACFQV4_22770 [Streptomyces thermocarboxydus]
MGPEGQVYILCQDGTIVELDAAATSSATTGSGGRRWDLQPSRRTPHAVLRHRLRGERRPRGGLGRGPMIRPEAEHVTGWGFTRRVASVEGGLVGITRDRFVFRADRDGTPRWRLRLPDLLHTVAVSPDGTRALVATNGGAVELDTADGSRRASLGVDGLPVWATAYLQDGARVLITRNGVIAVLDPEDRACAGASTRASTPSVPGRRTAACTSSATAASRRSRSAWAWRPAGRSCCPTPSRTRSSPTDSSSPPPTACSSPPTTMRASPSPGCWRTCPTTPRRSRSSGTRRTPPPAGGLPHRAALALPHGPRRPGSPRTPRARQTARPLAAPPPGPLRPGAPGRPGHRPCRRRD